MIIITKTKLQKVFDRYAPNILSDYLEQIDRTKKKERTKYKVIKILPTKEAYAEMEVKRFTITVSTAVSSISDAEELRDELQDWYDNIPEQFQNGDKGDQLQDAISSLEQVSEPNVPDTLAYLTFVHMPSLTMGSRSGRLCEVISILGDCRDFLESIITKEKNTEEDEKKQQLIEDIDEAISNYESVEFPGMF